MSESSYYYRFFDQVESRIDENYNNPKYDEINEILSKTRFKTIVALGDPNCLKNITSGKTPRSIEYIDNGIPFMGGSNIQCGKLELEDAPKISPEMHESILKSSQIRKDDVLISMAGTIGRCAVYTYSEECNANQAVAILLLNTDNLIPEFLAHYLNSRVGQLFFGKLQHISSQPNINLDEIKKIKIVLPERLKQEDILEKVKVMEIEAIKQDAEAIKAREEAENFLLSELGISLPLEEKVDYYSFDFNDIENRISYGNYHPSVRQLNDILNKAKYEVMALDNLINLQNDSIEPSKNKETEYNYIGLENIESNTGRLRDMQKMRGKDILSKSNIFKKSQLMFSGLRPYLNKCFILEDYDEAIGSAELFVCEPKEGVSSSFLKWFILSEAILRQTRWILSGASYPRLDEYDFLNLKIVIPDDYDEQVRIARRVEEKIVDASVKEKNAKENWDKANSLFEELIFI